MPKKSRKEKILAQQRRVARDNTQAFSYSYVSVGEKAPQQPSSLTYKTDVIGDLTKTIILSVIAITVEVTLFFILR